MEPTREVLRLLASVPKSEFQAVTLSKESGLGCAFCDWEPVGDADPCRVFKKHAEIGGNGHLYVCPEGFDRQPDKPVYPHWYVRRPVGENDTPTCAEQYEPGCWIYTPGEGYFVEGQCVLWDETMRRVSRELAHEYCQQYKIIARDAPVMAEARLEQIKGAKAAKKTQDVVYAVKQVVERRDREIRALNTVALHLFKAIEALLTDRLQK